GDVGPGDDAQAQDGEHDPGPGGGRQGEAGGEHGRAQGRAQGGADVQRGVVQGGGQRGGVGGGVHEEQLQGGAQQLGGHGDDEQHEHPGDGLVGDQREHGQGHGHAEQAEEDGAVDAAVGQAPGEDVADGHADAEDEQRQRHGPFAQAQHARDDLADVAVEGEHAAEADGADAQGEPHLDAAQGLQLPADRVGGGVAFGVPRLRDQSPDRQGGGGGDQHDDHIGRAPADALAERGGGRHADHGRDRQPQHHQRPRAG